MAKSCVLFFVKYPEKGHVKTRLAKDFGEEQTCELYGCFVLDILEKINTLSSDIVICFDPLSKKQDFKDWLGADKTYYSQEGGSLGDRLGNAFQFVWNQGYNRAIVLGSDSPDLPLDILSDAFQKLEQEHAVIGPTSDGGYYLLGFQKTSYDSDIFKNITWSTEHVFEQTMEIFNKKNKNVHILPEWYDVDVIDDVKTLCARNQNTEFRDSKTMTYLMRENL